MTESELSAAIAAALAGQNDPRVVMAGNFGTPWTTLGIVDRTLSRFTLNMLNAQQGVPDRPEVTLESAFVGVGMRRKPQLRYVPSRLSLVPKLFATALVPSMVVVHTSLPRDGVVSLGIEVNVLPAAIESVKRNGGIVVAQMNPKVPHTLGDAIISTDVIDYGIEVDEKLMAAHEFVPTDTTDAIGQAVAGRIEDGSTLQMGIGAVPDSVLGHLRSRTGLRVWTEMFSDGVLELERSGCMDAHTPLTASFLFGTQELYDWVNNNPRVILRRTETTNQPRIIAQQPKMTSMNTALEVDLFAQANASRIDARIYSGFGGQTDFIVGALHADGGQAMLALRSWHPKADVSTIIPLVDEPVTSFQPTAVITEQGTAQIFGHDEKTQASNLITQAAHPDIRAELWEEAAELGLT